MQIGDNLLQAAIERELARGVAALWTGSVPGDSKQLNTDETDQ
jgi:hypothetical protein